MLFYFVLSTLSRSSSSTIKTSFPCLKIKGADIDDVVFILLINILYIRGPLKPAWLTHFCPRIITEMSLTITEMSLTITEMSLTITKMSLTITEMSLTITEMSLIITIYASP